MVRHRDSRPRWFGWRCTACGERTDALIEVNRAWCRSASWFGIMSSKAYAEQRLKELLNETAVHRNA